MPEVTAALRFILQASVSLDGIFKLHKRECLGLPSSCHVDTARGLDKGLTAFRIAAVETKSDRGLHAELLRLP